MCAKKGCQSISHLDKGDANQYIPKSIPFPKDLEGEKSAYSEHSAELESAKDVEESANLDAAEEETQSMSRE